MTIASVEPRLRAAVDASLAWYDTLCALHGVRCRIEDDTWVAYDPPPPLHSNAKTVEPGAGPERALAALAAQQHGSVADSFGLLDLSGAGLTMLFEARWIHRPPPVADLALPPGWQSVRTLSELEAWTARHDTANVLLPGLLDRSGFMVLARDGSSGTDDGPGGGAVTHLCGGVVDVSNVWTDGSEELHWSELVAVVGALYPGRALVGYEQGEGLVAAREAGFQDVGPQRVWVR